MLQILGKKETVKIAKSSFFSNGFNLQNKRVYLRFTDVFISSHKTHRNRKLKNHGAISQAFLPKQGFEYRRLQIRLILPCAHKLTNTFCGRIKYSCEQNFNFLRLILQLLKTMRLIFKIILAICFTACNSAKETKYNRVKLIDNYKTDSGYNYTAIPDSLCHAARNFAVTYPLDTISPFWFNVAIETQYYREHKALAAKWAAEFLHYFKGHRLYEKYLAVTPLYYEQLQDYETAKRFYKKAKLELKNASQKKDAEACLECLEKNIFDAGECLEYQQKKSKTLNND